MGETVEDDEADQVRAFTPEQLNTFLTLAPGRHRLLFELLAATGLRISEAFALQWKHLALDGTAHVKVRRAYVRGKLEPPKTRHGRRDVFSPTRSSSPYGSTAERASGHETMISCSRL